MTSLVYRLKGVGRYERGRRNRKDCRISIRLGEITLCLLKRP
jgi:hypothetical protein